MADFTIKRGDRLPVIQATIKDDTGTVVDLTGATVDFHMVHKTTRTVKVDAAASVVTPATGGVVQYAWAAGDTDTAGFYDAEFEVTTSASKKITAPNYTYISIEVYGDLA